MPKLSNAIKTIEVSLPSFEDAKVTVRKDIRAGDIEDQMEEEDNRITAGLKILTALVKDWNLENDDGEIAEINLENMRELPRSDVEYLLEKVGFTKEKANLEEGQQK